MLAIPYNPYPPEPYQRWILKAILGLPQELKVAIEGSANLNKFNAVKEIANELAKNQPKGSKN